MKLTDNLYIKVKKYQNIQQQTTLKKRLYEKKKRTENCLSKISKYSQDLRTAFFCEVLNFKGCTKDSVAKTFLA